MKLDEKKECLWIHNLWLIEEQEIFEQNDNRINSIRKVILALTAHEPSDEQKQIIQRLDVM